MRRRSPGLVLAVATAALVAGVAACGDPGGDGEALTRTARRLDEIRSGVLTLRLMVASGGGGEPGEQVGFELVGPFSLDSIGPLPPVELEYTRLRGTERDTLGFTSTGHKAYVRSGGVHYEIPEDRWDGFRLDPGEGEHPGLSELRVDRWVVGGEVVEDRQEAGVRVDVIRGDLDVGAALADLLALVRRLGVPAQDAPALLREGDVVHLAGAVRSARAEVVTGRSDRLLRRLAFDVALAPREDDPVRPALGALGGARLSLDLRIEDPNKQVTVAEPIGARPLSQLGGKR